MKIVYEHILNSLVDKPDIKELSEKLFQLGHEHKIEGSIFDMEFTPNRGDCLSLQGLVRDLNVFYKTNLDISLYPDDIPLLDLNFINKAQEECPQISFLNIEIKGKVSVYKNYLENYFQDLKINKNNFFADISNYIAYEMGQPTHSYDFAYIGDDITLNQSKMNSKFKTLHGNIVDLQTKDLVFSSEEKIINLSGIMGGADTACSKITNNALIECAYFKPESIIGKAIKYNLHSDASHKFERGTDPRCHEKVLRRFIKIVSDHAEIIKLELYRQNTNDYKEIELDLDYNKINKILGTNITEEVYKDSLIKLGFDVKKNIKVPSFRSDISHQNDLAEELARVIGYDNLPINSIKLNKISKKLNISNEEKIKSFLVDKGFMEVINSPFCLANNKNSIKVDNPLDSNRAYIRTNIIDSLIENLTYNEKRQQDSIKLFEVSDIYTYSDIPQKKLAIIISGRKGQNYIDFSQKLDKKYLIDLFKEIDIDIEKFILTIDRNKLDSKLKNPIFALELKIDMLPLNTNNHVPLKDAFSHFIKYQPISEFPSSYRDLSFSVTDVSKLEEVKYILSNTKPQFLKDSFLFDFFENKKTNEIKIGYRFIFQSHKKTLTDEEINKSIKQIINPVLCVNSVSLPGSE